MAGRGRVLFEAADKFCGDVLRLRGAAAIAENQ